MQTVKARRAKHWETRQIKAAYRAMKKELGDHRRWWWQATMPYVEWDQNGNRWEVSWHPRYGRLYESLDDL